MSEMTNITTEASDSPVSNKTVLVESRRTYRIREEQWL